NKSQFSSLQMAYDPDGNHSVHCNDVSFVATVFP
ncbi:unnamed protein product, partial [marine sediment metagenome]